MAQTNIADYGYALSLAQAGQLYDLTMDTIDSLTAVGAVPFGAPVALDTDETASVVNSTADKFVGIAVFTHARENDGVKTGYVEGDRMNVLRFGRIWVKVEAIVVKEDPAYVTAAGTITNVAGTNIPIGRFMTSAPDNGLAVVEVTKALQGAQGPQGTPGV